MLINKTPYILNNCLKWFNSFSSRKNDMNQNGIKLVLKNIKKAQSIGHFGNLVTRTGPKLRNNKIQFYIFV